MTVASIHRNSGRRPEESGRAPRNSSGAIGGGARGEVREHSPQKTTRRKFLTPGWGLHQRGGTGTVANGYRPPTPDMPCSVQRGGVPGASRRSAPRERTRARGWSEGNRRSVRRPVRPALCAWRYTTTVVKAASAQANEPSSFVFCFASSSRSSAERPSPLRASVN